MASNDESWQCKWLEMEFLERRQSSRVLRNKTKKSPPPLIVEWRRLLQLGDEKKKKKNLIHFFISYFETWLACGMAACNA